MGIEYSNNERTADITGWEKNRTKRRRTTGKEIKNEKTVVSRNHNRTIKYRVCYLSVRCRTTAVARTRTSAGQVRRRGRVRARARGRLTKQRVEIDCNCLQRVFVGARAVAARLMEPVFGSAALVAVARHGGKTGKGIYLRRDNKNEYT